MPKLQAAVPAGAPPNALLRVRLPDGNEVNVRVPEGLKPGDEFIFEVSSIGEITSSSSTTTAIGTRKDNSGSGGGKGEKSNQKKKTPKNPKKNKRSNNPDNDSRSHGRGGGDHHSQQHHHHNHPNNNAGGAPGFVTGFFNMYNQVYDILSHNNTFTPQPTRPSGTNGMGNNNNTARQGNLSRQSSRGNKGSNSNNNNNNNNNNNQNNNNLQSSNNNAPPPSPRPISSQSRPRISASKIETSTSMNTMNNNTGAPLTFLDRELSTPRDFLTALGVGILIGLSIVMGFLAGVLYVTPITKDDSVVQ